MLDCKKTCLWLHYCLFLIPAKGYIYIHTYRITLKDKLCYKSYNTVCLFRIDNYILLENEPWKRSKSARLNNWKCIRFLSVCHICGFFLFILKGAGTLLHVLHVCYSFRQKCSKLGTHTTHGLKNNFYLRCFT
jgi:hypothetical protein